MDNEINKDYINDAFTKTGDSVNLEADNFNVSCITSKNNKFNLDSEGNLTVKSINVLEGNTLEMQDIFNVVYPIGSIYISVIDVNPGTLFGGSWEQLKDRFLIGCGNKYNIGVTGGEEQHTLNVLEMPSHTHGFTSGTANVVANRLSNNSPCTWTANKNGLGVTEIAYAGGSQPHNNMPPYLAISMWKRIA